MAAALEAGEPVVAEVGGVAADSLGAARVGDLTFPIVRDHVDRMVQVEDEDIRAAQRAALERLPRDRRAGRATAFAALRIGAHVPSADERVCVVLSGANCDPSTVTG